MQGQPGQAIAQWPLAVGAIAVSSTTPLRFRSGWASLVYVDIRKILSKVQARDAIVDAALALARREGIGPEINVLVGADYQVFRPNLESILGAKVHHLCTGNGILRARNTKTLSVDEINLVKTFLSNAAGWSARHSGIKELT